MYNNIFFLKIGRADKLVRTSLPLGVPVTSSVGDVTVDDSGNTIIGEKKNYYIEVSDSAENVLPSGFAKAKDSINTRKKYDLCTVGAGLSGTVFAERAATILNQKVLVMDVRPHIGGNCYDFWDQKTGILRNQYGSHLFHTKMKHVWEYVSQTKAPLWKRWYHYKFGLVNGTYVPIPVNIMTVNRLLNIDIQTPEDMDEWLKQVQIPCPETGCENAEQMAKSRVGEELYKLVFEGYTKKQWHKDPSELKAEVTARIPIVKSWDPRYFSDKWQALPGDGYTAWFAAMLDHPNIDVVINTDFFDHKEHLEQACGKIVYTGPIDRYFEKEGMEKLEYRSVTFREERHYNNPGYILPTPVLNFPGLETNYTRAIEYKQYLHRPSKHTLVVYEASTGEGDPYYPVPTTRNQELYAKYQNLAEELEKDGKIQFVGRLANYKYYNMDQAIDNALQLFWKGTTAGKFMENEFQAYKKSIDEAMEVYQQNSVNTTEECNTLFWRGEFGMELRLFVPWANHIRSQCGGIATSGTVGTKYMYFFSSQHTIRDIKREFMLLPDNNPFKSSTVHMSKIPEDTAWTPPNFVDFFRRPEFETLLNGKPLVVILNKYNTEWHDTPANYFSEGTLNKMLKYLTPKYTVLYKRHTASEFADRSSTEKDMDEKEMIRKKYPDVLFFEDFADRLDDVEDSNLLLFGFMSQSKRFLTVQGGTAVTGSFFGGTNIILIKKGKEIKGRDYNYFHRFSNAEVIERKTDEKFLAEMMKQM